ncbi:hypothetical protein KBY93_12285 [Synechococcus sp. J7-Johnson]|nr:hypothetical protein [Synechococcus sp. J7-Johnson]
MRTQRLPAMGSARPLPLPLAIARAVRIRRELSASLADERLPADQLHLLAVLRCWHGYKDAARSIARFPHLYRLLSSCRWI